MSLETKIRELMESKKAKAQQLDEALGQEGTVQQGSSEKAAYTVIDPHTGAASNAEDSTVKKGAPEAQVKQGDSQSASYTEQDPHNAATTVGSATGAGQNAGQGAGSAPNYEAGIDTASVVNQANSKGNVKKEDVDVDDETTITEEDIEDIDETDEEIQAAPRKIEMNLEDLRKDIDSVFAADTNLSEEFKTQASKIFEAAVIARVNHEVEQLTAELSEQNAVEFETLKEGLVEKVDSYLNYVIEQWMKDNEIAVEQGLRTEVAEDFMLGLKNLFQEHYFEVPEDRIDVLEDMSAKVDEASAKLDETIAANVALKTELDNIKRDRIVEAVCKDLTATDAEKMSKLLEGVEFDNETLFAEKVKVVKENYFPGNTPASPEKMLEEQVQNQGEKLTEQVVTGNMKVYAEALGRTAKFNK
jgi:hypothetical protein